MSSLDDARVGLPSYSVRAKRQRAPADDAVHYGLHVAAAYAWRLIVLGVTVYVVFFVLAKSTCTRWPLPSPLPRGHRSPASSALS